jgi:hypothetical protein
MGVKEMHDIVRTSWLRFNEPLEGRVHYMYLDSRGLLTTGIGNLIDATALKQGEGPRAPTPGERGQSIARALQFRWIRDDHTPATPEEVAAGWDTVRSRLDLVTAGGGAFESLTQLRVTDDEIDRFVFAQVAGFEGTVVQQAGYTEFGSWPASAQLATLSLTWATGPANLGGRFPNFTRHVGNADWAAAASECTFLPNIGTIKIRNGLDRLHLRNAADATTQGLDVATLSASLDDTLGVQHALWMLGYNPGPQDGADGGLTQKGIKEFQGAAALPETGVVDVETLATIVGALGRIGWSAVRTA